MADVAIVLPGANYNRLGPAIRFPVLAAWEAGYQSTVAVEYPPEAMRNQHLQAVVGYLRRQLNLAVNFNGSVRVTVIVG